jgi:hypothetical protein
MVEQCQKDLLHHVVSQSFRSAHLQREPVNGCSLTPIQFGEGVAVDRGYSLQQAVVLGVFLAHLAVTTDSRGAKERFKKLETPSCLRSGGHTWHDSQPRSRKKGLEIMLYFF